jgi:hypothetical protein
MAAPRPLPGAAKATPPLFKRRAGDEALNPLPDIASGARL